MKNLFAQLQFDPETEKIFREDYFSKSILSIRIGLVLAIVLYSSFGILDLWIVPESKTICWAIRLIFIACTLLTLYSSGFLFFQKHYQLILSLLSIIAGLGIIAMLGISTPRELGFKFYYTGLLLVIMWAHTFIRLRFLYSTAASIIITLLYELAAVYMQNLTSSGNENLFIFINNNFFFLSANIIGMFASFHMERFARINFLQNLDIKKENEENIRKNIKILEQNEEIQLQKVMLENKNREVLESIRYAQRIQAAILPSSDLYDNIPGEYFLFFKPKDIVSGDFFWLRKEKNMLYFCVGDCTGHGVPGAFMSVLAVSSLNEIMRKREDNKASDMLDHLRMLIIETLQQKGAMNEQKDGVDISMCTLDTSTGKLNFSGANNPLFIIGSEGLREIKPNKQPAAIYQEMKPFTNHEIQLFKGDCVYLASDGFQDQFGGIKNKKFLIRNLKNLLLSMSSNPMNRQREMMEETFRNWKGNNEQIDDVTVFGMKYQ